MTKRLLVALFAAALLAPLPATLVASADAAQERTSPAPTPPPPPPAPPAASQAPPPAPPAPPQAPRPPQPSPPPTNVQLDVVITDTISGKPEVKRITLLLRPGRQVSIRTQGQVSDSRPSPILVSGEMKTFQQNVETPVELALDGSVSLLGAGLVDVFVTFNYAAPPRPAGSDSTSTAPTPARVTENLAVVLRSGQPLLVSRSADPVTNRTVTVELTATIREP